MIGKKAGVIVQPAKGLKPAKFASMHDLRRTFANQLRKAGVRLDDVAVVIRHASTEMRARRFDLVIPTTGAKQLTGGR